MRNSIETILVQVAQGDAEATIQFYKEIYKILEENQLDCLEEIAGIFNQVNKLKRENELKKLEEFKALHKPTTLAESKELNEPKILPLKILTADNILTELVQGIGNLCYDPDSVKEDENTEELKNTVVARRVKIISDFLKNEKNNYSFNEKLDPNDPCSPSKGQKLLHHMLGLLNAFDLDLIKLVIEKTDDLAEYREGQNNYSLLDTLATQKLLGISEADSEEDKIHKKSKIMAVIDDLLKKGVKFSDNKKITDSLLHERVISVGLTERYCWYLIEENKIDSLIDFLKSAETYANFHIENASNLDTLVSQRVFGISTLESEEIQEQKKSQIASIVDELISQGVTLSDNPKIFDCLLSEQAFSTGLTERLCLKLIEKDNIDLFLHVLKRLNTLSAKNSPKQDSGNSTPLRESFLSSLSVNLPRFRDLETSSSSSFSSRSSLNYNSPTKVNSYLLESFRSAAAEIVLSLIENGKITLLNKRRENTFYILLKEHIEKTDNFLNDLWSIVQRKDSINSYDLDFFQYKNDKNESIFHLLIKTGNLNLITSFVERLESLTNELKQPGLFLELLNSVDDKGNNLLHIAAANKTVLKIIQYLIDKGVKKDALNNLGQTTLHIACKKKEGLEAASIDELFDKNIINKTDERGYPPIFYAIEGGFLETTKSLLKKGKDIIDVNLKVSNVGTPLTKAIEGSHEKIMELLLEAGANPNLSFVKLAPNPRAKSQPVKSEEILPLNIAVKQKNFSAIETLIKYGANETEEYKEYFKRLKPEEQSRLNEAKEPPLITAIKTSNHEQIKKLLTAGADPNSILKKQGGKKSSTDLKAQGEESGNALNSENEISALSLAIEKQDLNSILLLLEYGAKYTVEHENYFDTLESKDKELILKAKFKSQITLPLKDELQTRITSLDKKWEGNSGFGIGKLRDVIRQIKIKIDEEDLPEKDDKPNKLLEEIKTLETRFYNIISTHDILQKLEKELEKKKSSSPSQPSTSLSISSFTSIFSAPKMSLETAVSLMSEKLSKDDFSGANEVYEKYQREQAKPLSQKPVQKF